jgi:hypothetical protein
MHHNKNHKPHICYRGSAPIALQRNIKKHKKAQGNSRKHTKAQKNTRKTKQKSRESVGPPIVQEPHSEAEGNT